jgi:RNA polymerase sigma-70 factor (ECF subfamily)
VVRTALNLNVSVWRRRRRELTGAGPGRDLAPSSDGGLASDAVSVDLITALRRLPVRQRQVVALRIFLDLDTVGTAKLLGIAPGTVTAHLTRALAALREEFMLDHQGEVEHER